MAARVSGLPETDLTEGLLSDFEKSNIELSSHGYSAKMAAEKLVSATSNIRTHRNNTIIKLEADSKMGVVSKPIRPRKIKIQVEQKEHKM